MNNTLLDLILEKSNWCEETEAADECWKCPMANTDSAICKNALIAGHLAENGIAIIPETGIGELSDGYHTFNELYHHRAMLFCTICNLFPDSAWKSKAHHDGSMYDGMFIVGITTDLGNATYHYNIDPYWELFDVHELDVAPEFDGHTPGEALERIFSLAESAQAVEWIPQDAEKPSDFISVMAHMSDADPFPATREAYTVNGKFFFPALREFHPVDKWAYLPEPNRKK